MRPALFAFIGIHRIEETGRVKDIDQLLIQPPFIRMVNLGDICVIARAEHVELANVDRVAELFQHAAVVRSNAIRHVGMTMKIAPIQFVSRAVMSPGVVFILSSFRCDRIDVVCKRITWCIGPRSNKRKILIRGHFREVDSHDPVEL